MFCCSQVLDPVIPAIDFKAFPAERILHCVGNLHLLTVTWYFDYGLLNRQGSASLLAYSEKYILLQVRISQCNLGFTERFFLICGDIE
ncbi:unknown [Bacteroides sp. CAG:770]|nr:unknown [Bacteroides sp. CAG:770]